MAHSEEIGRELRSISGTAAGLPADLPFTVPSGFFESFPERMLNLARLSDLKERPTFQVPEGYFDHFAEALLKRIRVDSQEKEKYADGEAADRDPLPSILAGLNKLPTFRVPEGYFDRLPEYLTGLASASDEGDHSALEEIHRLSPLLASLQGQYPGTVPSGYFEHFPQKTREALLEALPFEPRVAQAPVVRMNGKLFPVRKMLAAAVTIGAVLLSAVWGYHIYDRPADFIRSGVNIKTQAQFNTALAKLSDQDIVDYLGSNTDVSDADLIASEVEDNQEGIQAVPVDVIDGSGQAGKVK